MLLRDEKVRNFVAGWGAGMLETLILYPPNKVIFRQQLYDTTTRQVLRELRNEGYWMLYRGVLPPLLQRTTTRCIMFGMFNEFDQKFGCAQYHTPLSSITCCSFAAFLAHPPKLQNPPSFLILFLFHAPTAGATEAVLCPFERTQVLLQAREFNKRYRNALEAMRSLAKIGITELYRGLSLVLLRNGLSNVIFFDLRNPLRDMAVNACNERLVKNEMSGRIPMPLVLTVGDFVSGGLLGAFISTLFFPVNVVKQRMQTTVATPFRTAAEVFRIIWKERNGSLREFFRGAALNFTRSLFAWGISNATYEGLRYVLSK